MVFFREGKVTQSTVSEGLSCCSREEANPCGDDIVDPHVTRFPPKCWGPSLLTYNNWVEIGLILL